MEYKKSITINLAIISALFLSSCATIVGGSRYNAHIIVSRKPNAKIIYKGEVIGTGSATIKVKRNQADKFSFSVKEDGCNEQNYNYTDRTFRGWAFAGSILLWTGVTPNGIPIPWGAVVDLATGAIWKPNTANEGLSKETYKTFVYEVKYASCSAPKAEDNKLILIDVVYLKNGSMIKGTILEQTPNVQVKIQTKDGSIFVFKTEEIEKLARELAKP